MRGRSSWLFRRFTQDKSMLFQDGVSVSGACRPVDFAGVLRTNLGCRTMGRRDGSNRGLQKTRPACRTWHAGGQNVGHRSHSFAKHCIMTGHWSCGPNPAFNPTTHPLPPKKAILRDSIE